MRRENHPLNRPRVLGLFALCALVMAVSFTRKAWLHPLTGEVVAPFLPLPMPFVQWAVAAAWWLLAAIAGVRLWRMRPRRP